MTEIGRALEEKIPLHATHKRLSRNLADESLEDNLGRNVLELGCKHINEDTLLIVDPSDIQKKYAKKMQYLAEVRDGSEDTIGNGYWLCEVVGSEVGSNEIIPLAQELWSQNAPDFKSDNDQILSLAKRVRQSTGMTVVVTVAGFWCRGLKTIPAAIWCANAEIVICYTSERPEGAWRWRLHVKRHTRLR